jgi:hypothetical protein
VVRGEDGVMVWRPCCFVALRVFELVLATFAPLMPTAAVGTSMALEPLLDRLRPPTAPIYPELREAYPPAPAGDWRENLP